MKYNFVFLFCLFSSVSFAQEVYLGVGLGTNGIDTDFASDSSVPISIDAKGTSYILRGGVELNKFVDIDLMYQSYGEVEFYSPFETNKYKWEPSSVSTNIGLYYPLSYHFEPYVSFGVGYIDLNESDSLMVSDSGITFKYGLGFKSRPLTDFPLSITLGYSVEMFDIETNSSFSNKVNEFSLESFYIISDYYF